MDYLTYLEADLRRLIAVSSGRLEEAVPSCPGWAVDDLLRHVAEVYLNKVECMRLNDFPEPWPPDFSAEPPEALLDRAYAELTAEFAARAPGSPARTWYGPDQTVAFWIRRMAQETVIHRIDGELAAGVEPLPVSDELALDGIDEVLHVFLAWSSREWPEGFAEPLSAGPGSVGITVTTSSDRVASRRWLVSWDATGVNVEVSDKAAGAEIVGAPEVVLRWLWGRAGSGVTVDGDIAQVAQMRQLLVAATQ